MTMAEITKKTRVAVVAESTENVAAYPSSGADFLAIQDGFSLQTQVDVLENAELKASIGKAKSIIGFENPSASISHYLRHSGTEGVAPQSGYSKLLKAAFGDEDVNSTEYNTVSGSTVSIVKVDTGEGANFAIGQALLVKHPANPWEIAVVKSISGDDLTLLFQLDVAPGTGVNLGKAVSYRAADSGHPTLSLHDYRGNGGAYQLVTGARVTAFNVEAAAGALLNASFELGGAAAFFNRIEIASTDRYLDFTDDSGTYAAVVAAGTYKTPHDLAAALQAAMDLQTSTTPTVTYSDSTGKFTIKTTGTLLSLLWNTGTNAANTIGDKIGFSTAANDTGTGATTGYTSDNALDFSSPYTPSFDDPGNPLVVKNNEVWLGTSEDSVCFGASTLSYSLSTPKTDIPDICAETGRSGSIIQSREVSVSGTATLSRYKADLFFAMMNNTSLSFQFAFGVVSGGNWVAGQSGCLHLKECTVSAHNLGDSDGIVTVEFEVQGHVDASGNSETALNLL
jgi:hypothetical protein